ncbi:hypothetical protein [Rhodococcus chondri]|uniref:Uncharacterized protein n=1 Tax=Rhodococcus chondri TaxID=3065941 RepID=A0ABU7JSH1_9NOCA|nr:hypothetical protein [Rhodococcus sp. CC-R104]MEE2032976.1 hypothetical protein [Rhodococcus sp. CC-R104]
MSSTDPRSWIDQLVGACVGLLIGAIALYCAVEVLRTLLPLLITIIGVLVLGGSVVAAARWYRGRW